MHNAPKSLVHNVVILIFFMVDFFTIIIVIMKIVENIDSLALIDNDVVLAHYIMGCIFSR